MRPSEPLQKRLIPPSKNGRIRRCESTSDPLCLARSLTKGIRYECRQGTGERISAAALRGNMQITPDAVDRLSTIRSGFERRGKPRICEPFPATVQGVN